MKQMYKALVIVLVLLCQVAVAQRTITGTVISSNDRQPVIGANVVVEGTQTGSVTDVDGKFSINVTEQAKNLTISYVGMKKKVVPIGSSNEVNVSLEADLSNFDEVVVTAIAIKREQRSLGYSTTTVKSDDLNKAADRSPLEALRGKVSGVNITSANGDPGSSTRVVLRGGSSILGNNQALIVVDGVPIDNSSFASDDVLNNNYDGGNRANDLNPQDIESITVLKGPAAAALYGQRAANGALIVTTKSGSKTAQEGRKFKVSYNSNFTFSNVLRLPKFQNEYGQGGGKLGDTRENFSWGPKFDGVVRPWGQVVDGKQKVKPYAALPNNVKEFFDLGKTFNNNISIEGGNKNTNYYLSFNNIKTNGVIPNTSYNRNSIRTNLTHNFSDKLSTTATFNYTKTQGDYAIQGQGDFSVYNQILQTPRDISLLELKDLTDSFNLPETYYGAYTINPWYALSKQSVTNNVDRFNSVTSLTYAPVEWLSMTGRFGADIYTDTRTQKLAKYSFGNQGGDFNYAGRYAEDIYRSNIYNSDIIISAGHTFKNGVTFGGLIGNNIFAKSLRTTSAATAGLNIEGLYTLGNSQDRPIISNTLLQRRLVGLFGEVNLDYKKYVFLNFSFRNDWSSTLPKGKNSYFYPSVNAAFVLTELVKIDPKILSYLKIRAGFAQAGSGGEDPYLLTNVFVENSIGDGYNESEVNSPYPSGGTGELAAAYTVSDNLRNPNLKPEKTTSWEIGTEIGFWNDRVNIDFTYYQAKSKDLILVTAPVAPSSGFTSQVINAGTSRNQGVELGLRLTPVVTASGFKWEVFGTFTKNNNKVLELPNGVDQITLGGLSDMAIVARKGEAYGSFYALTAQRDPQGRVVVDPVSGQPLLADEAQILGSYQPNWLGSLGTSLSYKGLKFSILFDTKQGGKIYSRTMDVQEFVGTSPNTLNNDREDFIVPNSVIETSPGVFVENTTVLANHQDYWTVYNNADRGAHLLSASFTKLREMSLSYSLPAKLLKKTKFITGVEVKFFGTNLALWTPKANTFIDPETSSYGAGNAQGFEFGTTPSLRNIGFGFKLDF
ncbi:MAG: SusC/RagA family TonB-linked outer membrane protein [Chitinophagales bacterium]